MTVEEVPFNGFKSVVGNVHVLQVRVVNEKPSAECLEVVVADVKIFQVDVVDERVGMDSLDSIPFDIDFHQFG